MAETLIEILKLILAGAGGWIASNIWQKHGSRMADRFPVIEKLGLAEGAIRHWFDEAIVLAEEIESRWQEKINLTTIDPGDIVTLRHRTDVKVDRLRSLKNKNPDDIPEQAVGVIGAFIEFWGEEKKYFQRDTPLETFRSKGDKIRNRAEMLTMKLEDLKRN